MSPKEAADFRKARAHELFQLASILPRYEVLRSADPLNDAARACSGAPGGDPHRWGVTLEALSFDLSDEDIKAQRHAKPPRLTQLELELDVRLSGDCRDQVALVDPFDALSVECVITGMHQGDADRLYHAAWHLERHDLVSEDADLVHPAYHFQYGGMRLPKLEEFGQHVLLDSPRLAHPPLDAVLAIDFVLSNYFPGRWRRLREDSGAYVEIVRDAQRRCWRPYSYAAAWQWEPMPTEIAWTGKEVWPQLV